VRLQAAHTESITGTFDQNAHHGRERRARLRTEERDGGSNGQLEEIGSTDQRSRRCHRVFTFSHFISP